MEKRELLKETTILTLVTWILVFYVLNVEASINCKREVLKGDSMQRCNGGYGWICKNMSLSEVPKEYPEYNASSRLCLLDLGMNNLTIIPNNSFKTLTDLLWLWLDENDLTRIDSGAFTGLHNLICLDLSTNSLQYPKSFADAVLKPLEKLEGLSLKNNPIRSYRIEDLLYPLENLKELYLTGCYQCSFGKGFRNFTKLTKLSLSGYYSVKYPCNISILFKETFINLPSLDSLKLSFCNISKVEYGALRPLTKLKNLTISHNPDLHFKGMKDVLSDLTNSSLELLDVSAIHEQFEQGTVLLKRDVEPIKYLKNLMFLHMDFNKLEVIEEEVFDLIPENLIHFWLSGNRLTYGKYVEKVSSMAHIRYLDLSRQHLDFNPLLQKHPDRLFGVSLHQDDVYESNMRVNKFDTELSRYYDKEFIDMNAFQTSEFDTESGQIEVYESPKRPLAPKTLVGGFPPECAVCQFLCHLLGIPCICAPENLQNVMWRASFVYVHIRKLMICKPNRLRKLDLSFNLLEEWIGPVYGLEKLEDLNLAQNVCYEVSSFFFDHFQGLRKLNISYNNLGLSLDAENPEAGTQFKNLKKMQTFDLSGNSIEALARDTFENMEELQYLYVKQNYLTQWNCTLNTKCLRLLDLSDNKIETLSDSFRDYLDSLAALSPEESCNRTSRLKVRLGGNPIRCNCENRPFLRWLSDSPVCVEFYMWDECHLQDGGRVQLWDSQVIPRFVDRLDRECVPYVFIGIAIGIFLISVGLCIIVYRFRWKLRHLYYSKRRRRHQIQGYDRIFERDAFISYAKTEAGFIKDKLIPSLEGDCGLKVWIADRDSLPGASIAENLTHAIYSSRKSILILSRRYFVESWCNYEMNMARIESIESQRKLLIIVLYEDISAKDMPLDYLRLLKTAESVEYPKHPQHHDTFWTSLARAIHEE